MQPLAQRHPSFAELSHKPLASGKYWPYKPAVFLSLGAILSVGAQRPAVAETPSVK
jgi:hypothetical protein